MRHNNLNNTDEVAAFCEPNNEKNAFLCNCPPSLVEWRCSEETYHAIRSGSSCAFYAKHNDDASPVPVVGTGGDADQHGCKASTGYEWCARLDRCIARWEHDLHTNLDVERYCNATITRPVVGSGGNVDKHGCKPSTGMEWCPQRNECIARWNYGVHSESDYESLCGGSKDVACGACLAREAEGENLACESCELCTACLKRQEQGENVACEMCEPRETIAVGAVASALGYWTYADESGCLQTSVNYAALWITMKGTSIDSGKPSSTIVHGKSTCKDLGYPVQRDDLHDLPKVIQVAYAGVSFWSKDE